ncbi:MAG: c-type cytochrome domain-containing protein [Myxococcota bacterium]
MSGTQGTAGEGACYGEALGSLTHILTARRFARRLAWALSGMLLGLSGCEEYHLCEAPTADTGAELPPRLSETGLFADMGSEALGRDVQPYRPRFEHWADGADKRRWVRLPPGARIDSSQMGSWRFPVGTRFWKEFVRDGVRVETRLMEKTGSEAGDWSFVSYIWNEAGDDALRSPFGAINARGTAHNVPAATECVGCHGGTEARALGFSAVQLPSEDEGLDLGELDAAWLTTASRGALTIPGTETEQAVLGYLHANCAHCHNQDRPPREGPRCFDPEANLDFSLRPKMTSSDESPTFRTVRAAGVVRPGRPDDSELIDRVSTRAFYGAMPPLGTEEVDREGVALLRRWVAEL